MKKLALLIAIIFILIGCLDNESGDMEILDLSVGVQLDNVAISSYGRMYYKFTVPSSNNYVITLSNLGSDCSFDLYNYISDESLVYKTASNVVSGNNNTNTQDEQKTVSLLAGDYLLFVDEWGRDGTSFFSLLVDIAP